MVPAPHVFQTGGFLRPIFTRDGGSCAPRRRFLRPIFTRDRGSCASCLPDGWVPAPICCKGRRFLRPTASVPAPMFLQGIVVPAPHVFQTDGLLRLIFTGGGGSCAPRRRFLRPIFASDRGSCASCLPDTWVPAPFFTNGGGSCTPWRRFLRLVGRGSRARAALAGTWRPSFQAAGRALHAPYNN